MMRKGSSLRMGAVGMSRHRKLLCHTSDDVRRHGGVGGRRRENSTGVGASRIDTIRWWRTHGIDDAQSVEDTRSRCTVKARGLEASRTRWINKLRDLEGSRSCRAEPTDGLEVSRNRWIDKTNCLKDSRSRRIDKVMVGRIPGAHGLTKPRRWMI